jgi:hypothetical protein
MARIACAYISENMANAMRHRTNGMWRFRCGALARRSRFARTDGPINERTERNDPSPPPARYSRRATCAGTAACQLPPKGLASREVHPDAIRSTTTRASLPVLIRRPVDCLRGAVRPVNVPETPAISPALRPLPLAVASVGYDAHGIPRDRWRVAQMFYIGQAVLPERGSAVSTPTDGFAAHT